MPGATTTPNMYVAAASNFLQLIWASTTQVGIGMAECTASNKTYLVAKYNPQGNLPSAVYTNEVMPPMFQQQSP